MEESQHDQVLARQIGELIEAGAIGIGNKRNGKTTSGRLVVKLLHHHSAHSIGAHLGVDGERVFRWATEHERMPVDTQLALAAVASRLFDEGSTGRREATKLRVQATEAARFAAREGADVAQQRQPWPKRTPRGSFRRG